MGENIQIQVEGMTCGNCVKSIQTNVGAMQGVQEVEVNLAEGFVDVAFDNSKTTVANISETIESLGFDVK